MFREKVRDFAAERITRALVAEMDERAEYCPKLVDSLFAEGLMGIEVPESYGGLGGTFHDVIVAIEEIAAVDPAVAVLVDVQNALVATAILRWGTGDQKRRYLPALAAGTVGAFAISEENSGSDAFALAATAEPDGDGFVLHGTKAWTTNAAEAGLFLVFAKAPQVTAFLVEDVHKGPRADKLGIRASSTCSITLDGIRVSADQVLGGVGNGAMVAVETLNAGKLGIAAQLTGLARGALDAAVRHARDRTQFGRRIGEFQGVRFPLARIAAELEAARALLYQTVAEFDDLSATERLNATAMAKLIASDVAERAASQSVETFGGLGFTKAAPVEKLYRDAKIGKIYEGTSNIQLRTIAATMLPEGATP